MTRYAPLWQQAGSYPASLDRGLISSLWPSGGVSGGVASAVAGTMTVSVAPGTAAVLLQSGQGAALCRWDANEIVTIATAPPSGQSRIDLICAQVRDNGLDAGGNNDFIMTVTAGTPAASNPAVPATPTNALPLVQVLVPGAVANLNTATLTDRRVSALGGGGFRASLYRSAAWQTSTAGQGNLFTFDTVGQDAAPEPTAALYNMGTGVFTCPVPGRYLVDAVISTTAAAAGQYLRVGVYRNVALVRWGPYNVMPVALTMMAGVSTTVRCAAGDQLYVAYMCSTPSLGGNLGAADTWGIFEYLGS
jgi:hypothetical protein